MAVLASRINKANGYVGVTIDLCYSNEYNLTHLPASKFFYSSDGKREIKLVPGG